MAVDDRVNPPATAALQDEDDGVSLMELGIILGAHLKLLIGAPLLVGALAYGATYLMSPIYTARTSLLPPQQSGGAASALASLSSLGALAGLAGGSIKTPGDQYVALLQSTTLQDRLIDQYKLTELYDAKYRSETRKELTKRSQIGLGKKDGLITIEVDDESPQRAADLANSHVVELRKLSDTLAIGEAQQRRVFFEKHLKNARDNLTRAQQALESSGFSVGAIRAEPKAAAEAYAQVKAAVTSAEVRLQSLRSSLSDSAQEVKQAQATLGALRSQLARLEQANAGDASNSESYVSRYREFKYQETLFDLFARQYELARVDESREGALIQVVDAATPPDRKSKPNRAVIAVAAALLSGLLLCGWVLLRFFSKLQAAQPERAERLAKLRQALAHLR